MVEYDDVEVYLFPQTHQKYNYLWSNLQKKLTQMGRRSPYKENFML